MFPNARNFTVSGGAFYNINGDFVQRQEDVGSKGIDLLRKQIALGAFHNSEERYDPPKCHPLTRQAVLDKLIAWIESMDPDEFRTFWLYGSAGVGKSAILQTIAELCHAKGLLLASFFFSRTSATRNSRFRLIPTLSYQIALCSPLLREYINRTVTEDPTTFERSLGAQLRTLVIEPLLEAHRHQDANTPPLIVLDGLDECSTTEDQCYILRELAAAFKTCPLRIRILIASRPEQRILVEFNCDALQKHSRRLSLDDHSLLSEAYADIEVFLRHKFLQIKTSHPLNAYIPPEWPTNSDVRIILQKASHHFVFVSTVIRFVDCPRHHPVQRLRAICDASFKTEETPFAELDALYSTILAGVENMKPVIEILGMLLVPRAVSTNQSISFISIFLQYTPEELRCHLMDLSSLVDLDIPDWSNLRIFHASFSDFLMDKRRSKEYYINHGLIHAHLAKLCLQYCLSWCQKEVVGNGTRFWSSLMNCQLLTYVNDNLVHHLRNAAHTRELQQQLARFDVTSVLIMNCGTQREGRCWVFLNSIMEKLRISTFPEAEATYTRQLGYLDHYLRDKLPIYQSDAQLRDLVTFMMSPLTDCSEDEDNLVQGQDPREWCRAVLYFTEDIKAKDARSVGLFNFQFHPAGESGVSYLNAFLRDPARAREFSVDGRSFASLALRFAKQLCEPSVQTRELINDQRAHRNGLRLFTFFLSRSSYSSELKEYLTSHHLVFRDSVDFTDAVQAILAYVELALPNTISN